MATTETFELDGRVVDEGRLAQVCERYGIAELAVFGSAARGEHAADSDIDLLYEPYRDAHLGFNLFDLEDELAELFGRPVDLVAKRSLHQLLRQDVLADALTLYAA